MTTEIQTQPTPKIYVPPKCSMLSDLGDSQIRLGLQGAPFSGKTTASLSFPNPIILSFDRKVSAHKHRTDVVLVPFHDVKFVSLYASWGQTEPVNRKDALTTWLRKEGIKVDASQTLILDGATTIEESFHSWFSYHESSLALTAKGEIDSFVRWNMAKEYFEELHLCLKSVPCNVIFICHENPITDKQGRDTGKFRPLLAGQSGNKFGGNLTDLFRSWAIDKPKTEERFKEMCKKFVLTESEGKEWCASTPDDHATIYLWQTQSDDICDCGTSSLKHQPKFVIASYNAFLKYRKPITT